MINRLTMWHHNDDVTREEALRQWQTDHARLVTAVPGLRGYVQNHCTASPEGGDIPYTGLGEVWFDSFEAAAAATATPEWAAVIADASRFMNLESIVAAWAEEHRIREAG